ncbi:hypothetical protein KQH42_06555 [Streptomyces sp. CHA1]|uniref:hypothetical protein n=1 Tax=Streptomyces TaxID=1883 RepID=UPI0001AEDF5D|nr:MULTISPECIES: hypothetical protein [Streptomyces]KIX79977.1 hypothetical protein SF12_00760 [Streptomyces sp. MBRL 601]BDH52041.1 hypothetical protein MTP02_30520 [Streptomyces albus]EFE82537.1 predicted protein [Streptomyces albidoflavus]MBP3078634.1 hypothetical protein [Streptomyces sp. 604F]MBT3158492.1 hypothetical protein [Streptomyces sp. G11C]
MTPTLPRTVRAVDTAQLLDLAQEAAMHGFSQRLPVDWLQEHLAAEATHYLVPTIVQHLRHRPDMPQQWRCRQLLTVRTGEQIWGLLDILPDTFDKIPETLDAASKKDIVTRLGQAVTQREWSERMSPEEMPRN